MNNLAKPFISSSIVNSFSTIAGCRTLLLFACMALTCVSSVRAQGEAAQAPATTTAPRVAAAASDTGGTITGRVVGEDGRPLSDAVIYLGRAYARTGGPPLTATTDSDGRFRITGLESGLFTVTAMLPGFTTPDTNLPQGETNYYRVGDSVNLTLVKGGVITGTVRDSNNEPVVAVAVRAVRVRDAMGRAAVGRSAGFSGFLPERMTDDRGVYRIYGLPPGAYLVSTGGTSQRLFGAVSAYEGDAPTFFPSSTRDTAAEVQVRGGEEATGIDIRYRGERGHAISGTVSGIIDTNIRAGVSITIRQISSGGYEGATFVMPGVKPGFAFNGMSDGEYEVMAQQFSGTSDSYASLPRRVTVKGADVTGVELVLSPLASISGRVQLEAPPKEKCAEGRGATLLETIINARRDEKKKTADMLPFPFFYNGGGIPTEQGEFTIRNLMPASYRLTARLADETWYVRSIILPGAAAAVPQGSAPVKSTQAKSNVATAGIVALKAGERLSNVTVQIAQDAAGLRGRVASATETAEGAQPPSNLKVYLVPVEKERAEDALRYAEAVLDGTGSFTFKNLAPGRYWITTRPVQESEPGEQSMRPLFWDAEGRAKLRREAEAVNTVLELQPCQRMSDYVLRYTAAK
jgi:hypothetical protein